MNFTRRNMLKTGLVAAAGITVYPAHIALSKQSDMLHEICVFSKCLQFLDYNQMAEVIAKLGFDGVDLTVRKDGHVLPENVTRNLPKAVSALNKVGKSIPMIATDIVDANDPITEDILATASQLGIKYYRMGRLKYDRNKNILQNLDKYRGILEKLEKLNRKYQLHGCIQNHSGPYRFVGAPVWDLYYLLKDFDPEYLGVQYDIMHATVEGGYSWPLGLELVSPWIKTIDIKDFKWVETTPGKWEAKIVPLGQGMVDYGKFMNKIKHMDIYATYSLHYEYDLGGAESGSLIPQMKPAEIYEKLRKDLLFFKTLGQPK